MGSGKWGMGEVVWDARSANDSGMGRRTEDNKTTDDQASARTKQGYLHLERERVAVHLPLAVVTCVSLLCPVCSCSVECT